MESRRGWEQIEDDRLKKIIKKYGTKNWTLIAEKLTMNTIYERTGKQCRQRWHNHLNPLINKNQWSKKEDEILFQAHRDHGSKWKEISKLFPGRTDNSIKNHFYSTVRRCLRKIGKIHGQIQLIITMKSIKPYVLSKIVQNTELTNFIVKIGREKLKGNESESFGANGTILAHIISELSRINTEYEQKRTSPSQNILKQQVSPTHLNILYLQEENPVEDPIENKAQCQRSLKMDPSVQSLKVFFEAQEQNHQYLVDRQLIMQTQSSKTRNEQGLSHMGQIMLEIQLKEKHPTAQKEQNQCRQWQDYSWVEQQSRNFFGSPSNKEERLPDLILLTKISRNSQSPGFIHGQQRIAIILPKDFQLKQQQMRIQFNPHDFFHRQQNE